MKHKPIFISALVILCLLLCSGCRSLFIPQNTVKVLNDDPANTVRILSLSELGNGIFQSAGSDGKTVLTFNTSDAPPITYDIELYQQEAGSWSAVNLLSSDKKIESGVISSDRKGIYYTETIYSEIDSKDIRQLVWSSLDRTTTKTISKDNENIVSSLCSMPDDSIMYANADHELIITDSKNNRHIMTFDKNLVIHTIRYQPQNHLIIFSAQKNDNDEIHLYVSGLDTNTLKPRELAKNILDFDINPQNGDIVFIQKSGSESELCVLSEKTQTTKRILKGMLSHVIASSDGQNVIYTQIENTDQLTESIWITDLSGKNQRQMTSPKKLDSNLYETNHTLFFTTVSEKSNIDNNTNKSVTYALTYDPK